MSRRAQDSDAARLAQISLAVQDAIDAAKRTGQIDVLQALRLTTWWVQFMSTFEPPQATRHKRMIEVIHKGEGLFPNNALFKQILGAFGIEKVCTLCEGSGMKKCWKCGGAGSFSFTPPAGVIMMPSRSPCDACYGQPEQCPCCDGRGFV